MSAIPTPAGKCRCGEDAGLRLVSVRSLKHGTEKTCVFSTVGSWKTIDGHTDWSTLSMHPGWAFEYWVEWCFKCWFGEGHQQELV